MHAALPVVPLGGTRFLKLGLSGEHMSRTSLALSNLRGFAIVMVVAFHSSIAYLASQPAAPLAFDAPPYGWLANPIIDSQRWFGLDLFCAFQYIYLMHLMFFLSGLFVYPSLARKGMVRFVFDRLSKRSGHGNRLGDLPRTGAPCSMASFFACAPAVSGTSCLNAMARKVRCIAGSNAGIETASWRTSGRRW